ncbi:ribosomal protein L4 domain-containing protein [Suillus plorans]|uniref:Ribosomal protein L4 domain-containing protein n=1 Tax=Suillus plorans TaxID=116603 RepID=A0A9P7AX47_9AGAM|nr:ribosomal protein L4 domain-containing protein [Suillus plorans]KAG1796648.1 ribosomal protein L4 domain-containing protein [Suillus plorans]
MASRPTVTVQSVSGEASTSLPLPAVLTAPIRLDVVAQVHKSMAKNRRQAYAVSEKAGHQTSAESWGTGRAVARIPRVGGGGTHRSGQAAFGNMCRGGRMFAPTKTWRKWHVKVNQNQRRFATVSALAASALPSLVLARGHRIEQIAEVPLVVDNAAESFKKTKEAITLLKALNAYTDVTKVSNSRKLRAGKGKMRNRRYRQRRGPLVVFKDDNGIVQAFRNLPGVELVNVQRLNLLQLAPGGHIGRFVIWTEGAFSLLDEVFGTFDKASSYKKDYLLPTAKISNPDVTRLINSTEIQSVVRPAGPRVQKRPWTQKKNPLVNKGVLFRMNPYAKTLRRQELRMYLIYLSFNQIDHSCITLVCYSQTGACQGTKRQERKEGQGLLCWRGFPQHVVRSLSVLKLWLPTSTSIVLACPYAFMPCKNCHSWRLYFASTSDQFQISFHSIPA